MQNRRLKNRCWNKVERVERVQRVWRVEKGRSWILVKAKQMRYGRRA